MMTSPSDGAIDFNSLTEAQRNALGLIAVNLKPASARKTLESLVKRGLIEEAERILPDDRFPVTIKVYTMPLAVHMQWCEWCSRNV